MTLAAAYKRWNARFKSCRHWVCCDANRNIQNMCAQRMGEHGSEIHRKTTQNAVCLRRVLCSLFTSYSLGVSLNEIRNDCKAPVPLNAVQRKCSSFFSFFSSTVRSSRCQSQCRRTLYMNIQFFLSRRLIIYKHI